MPKILQPLIEIRDYQDFTREYYTPLAIAHEPFNNPCALPLEDVPTENYESDTIAFAESLMVIKGIQGVCFDTRLVSIQKETTAYWDEFEPQVVKLITARLAVSPLKFFKENLRIAKVIHLKHLSRSRSKIKPPKYP